MHVRSLSPRRPAALDIDEREDFDAFDAGRALADALERAHGMRIFASTDDDCVLLPPPHEVYLGPRTLRGDEYEAYADAVLAAASRLPVRAIRLAFEQLYPFDWDAFAEPHWAALRAAQASLPGWLPGDELPRWFGRDERKGPFVWASVEPSGLHVVGLLDAARLDDWHARLLASTRELPHHARR